MPAPQPRPRRRTRPERGHEVIGHTADARVRAWARELPGVFEEAAAALSELTVAVAPGVAASRWLVVELAGRDLDHLAYAWLNDVISASEVEHRGVIAAEVTSIERPEGDEETDPWRLHARVGLGGFDDRVRALRHAKGASLHGLHVRERAGRWTMEALLDL